MWRWSSEPDMCANGVVMIDSASEILRWQVSIKGGPDAGS